MTNTAGTAEPGTCQAGDCVPTPGTEICNGLDDDCDGKIDEGLVGCDVRRRRREICDGMDDDCDGKIDEDITRACGINVGVCTPASQTCDRAACSHGCTGNPPCNGAVPSAETCNGLDDDCDGVVDGLTQACSTLPGSVPGAAIPRNNPGDPHSGKACATEAPRHLRVSPGRADVPGADRQRHVRRVHRRGQPAPEICNGLDDDCDGNDRRGLRARGLLGELRHRRHRCA